MGMDEVASWVCGVYIGEDEAVGTFGLETVAGRCLWHGIARTFGHTHKNREGVPIRSVFLTRHACWPGWCFSAPDFAGKCIICCSRRKRDMLRLHVSEFIEEKHDMIFKIFS
jgi:hypothetical protein